MFRWRYFQEGLLLCSPTKINNVISAFSAMIPSPIPALLGKTADIIKVVPTPVILSSLLSLWAENAKVWKHTTSFLDQTSLTLRWILDLQTYLVTCTFFICTVPAAITFYSTFFFFLFVIHWYLYVLICGVTCLDGTQNKDFCCRYTRQW